MINVVMEMR